MKNYKNNQENEINSFKKEILTEIEKGNGAKIQFCFEGREQEEKKRKKKRKKKKNGKMKYE